MITYVCFMLLYLCAVSLMMSDNRVTDKDVTLALFLTPVWPIGLVYSVFKAFQRG